MLKFMDRGCLINESCGMESALSKDRIYLSINFQMAYHIYSLVAVENLKGEEENINYPFHDQNVKYWYMLRLKEEKKTERVEKDSFQI